MQHIYEETKKKAQDGSLNRQNRRFIMKKVQILLVDDQELVRQGLRHMLESEEDIEVIGDCANAEEAFCNVARLHPDIVLMDTQMPGMSGIEATRNLKRNGLDYGGDVIILAESVDYQAEALEAGAASYLLKDLTRVELAQAIKQVYRNGRSLEERDGLIEEVIELVVPPPANAAELLRFMCELEELLHNDFAGIICTVGSWDCGAVITILVWPTVLVNLPESLENMPEVEKAEEEPLARGALSTFSRKFGFLPRPSISLSKRIRVTLKEPNMARQEFATLSN